MKKKTLIKYAIYFGLGLLMAGYNIWSQEFFNADTLQEKMGELSDCFFFPAVLLGGVGALTWIAGKGTFDMLSYGFSHFIGGIVNPRKRMESFYEYKMRKEEKGDGWVPEMFFSGMVFLAISLIFLVIYFVLE